MKQEQIIDAMNKLPENMLEETNHLRAKGKTANEPTPDQTSGLRRFSVPRPAFAACIGLLLGGALLWTTIRLVPKEQANEIPKELTMLTITTNGPISEMGAGGGLCAYDISEWVNNNPWNEDAELSTLPVYRNRLTYNEQFQVQGTNFEKMEALLMDVIDGLDLDAEDFDISDNAPSAYLQQVITEKLDGNVPEGYFNPTEMRAKSESIQIYVSADLTAEIRFDPAVTLPDKYHFTHFASYKDMEAVAGYFKRTYKDLLSFQKPQANIYGGDYNIYLQQNYDIAFFDGKGSLTEQIINYNFNRVVFYCDDEGNLDLIRIFRPDLSEKVGNYPIRSIEEATGQLLTGNYYFPTSSELPEADCVAGVELIYRTGQYEKYFMPYYLFYVELPERERADGLKTYGLYYVPAVEEKYIINDPKYYPMEG